VDDIVADTFFRFFRYLKRPEVPLVENPKSFLLALARNTALEALHAKQRSPKLPATDAVVEAQNDAPLVFDLDRAPPSSL
jgi:DNA-directed RNA polymerase specialized sigma24 family protein